MRDLSEKSCGIDLIRIKLREREKRGKMPRKNLIVEFFDLNKLGKI